MRLFALPCLSVRPSLYKDSRTTELIFIALCVGGRQSESSYVYDLGSGKASWNGWPSDLFQETN